MKTAIKKILVKNRKKRIGKAYRKKIDTIIEKSTIELDDKNVSGDYWNTEILKSDNRWAIFYMSVSNIKSEKYVPEDIYYSIIEPILNKKEHSASYKDKNIYDMLYDKGIFPATYMRNVDGFFYDSDYKTLSRNIIKNKFFNNFGESVVLKPTLESNGGNGVELFVKKNNVFLNKSGVTLTLEYLDKTLKKNYILQEKCTQHPFFEELNQDSINTIRVLMYRSVRSNKLIPLHAVLRIGAKGQFVDNTRAGGLSCGINIEKKCLNNYAVDNYGNQRFKVNGISLVQKNEVPVLEKVITQAKKIAKKNIHHRLLGLDMFVDSNEDARCIEINNEGNGINIYQLNNGSLFGEYSKEVKDYVKANLNTLYNRFEI